MTRAHVRLSQPELPVRQKLVAIASDDALVLGVLSSGVRVAGRQPRIVDSCVFEGFQVL